MFTKVLQLIAPNPLKITWMFEHGVKNFEPYAFSNKDVIDIATTGTVSISSTSKLNKIIDENLVIKNIY